MRWSPGGRQSWRRRRDGGFDSRLYEVREIWQKQASPFVASVHYLRTMPIGGLHTTAAWPYEWARRDFVTPGADCGIHMVDDAGREIRFRNPINSAESYSTMQYHERVEVNGGTCGGEIN